MFNSAHVHFDVRLQGSLQPHNIVNFQRQTSHSLFITSKYESKNAFRYNPKIYFNSTTIFTLNFPHFRLPSSRPTVRKVEPSAVGRSQIPGPDKYINPPMNNPRFFFSGSSQIFTPTEKLVRASKHQPPILFLSPRLRFTLRSDGSLQRSSPSRVQHNCHHQPRPGLCLFSWPHHHHL